MFYLLLLTLQGDEYALAEQMYEQYKQRMYTIAYYILQNEQDAEDAVEDASLKIIEYINSFIDASPAKREALIVLYTKSASIDIYRKRKQLPLLILDQEDKPVLAQMDETPEKIVLTAEYVERLKGHLTALQPMYREVLVYKYFHEKSDREIAEMLHIKENTVRTRLTRARHMLRKNMEVENG